MKGRNVLNLETTADELPQIERSSLTQRVVGLIRQAIVTGVLPPGSSISLRDVANRLGVSPTPVREALFQLSATGLVEFVPGRIQIAAPTPTAVREAFELREALEGMASRLAAMRRSDADAAHIHELAARGMAAAQAGDAQAFRAADLAFHQSIAAASGSKHLQRYTMNALDLALTLRNLRLLGRSFTPAFGYMHQLIAEAIERRDPDRAESLAREHVRNVYQMIMSKNERDHPGTPDPAPQSVGEGNDASRLR